MAGIAFTNFPAISGGLPTRPDLAPSIVFIVAYFGLLFPTLWRTYTYRRPRMLLFTFFRLIAFILIRIATFGLRASEAVNDSIPFNPVPDIGVFIAEQILLGIGYIVMVDLQVELSERHIGRTDIPEQEETIFAKKGKAFLQRLVFLMHTALLAAMCVSSARLLWHQLTSALVC
ncbi:hypothetical protein CALVIDRAFT_537996 [Calocera viscosa TUFC12733]|uniref:Uncharacterized protein n=1 Tax=Calocera viscosa (strain TUFC12733) TaxID=1330018 RepID=A0A167LEF9_CALVF|nr:hypothetical protein CALVIDRAFT_537996 [Calocera viscosa TUFC12733]